MKTLAEIQQLKDAKKSYKTAMRKFFGDNWRRISERLDTYNAPQFQYGTLKTQGS